MFSPSQSPLPPPSPPVPSRFSQCTRSERLSHASNLAQPVFDVEIRRARFLLSGLLQPVCRQRTDAEAIKSFSCWWQQLGIWLPVDQILLILLTSMGCDLASLFSFLCRKKEKQCSFFFFFRVFLYICSFLKMIE